MDRNDQFRPAGGDQLSEILQDKWSGDLFQLGELLLIVKPVIQQTPKFGGIFDHRGVKFGKNIEKAGTLGESIDHLLIITPRPQVLDRFDNGVGGGTVSTAGIGKKIKDLLFHDRWHYII